MLVTPAPTRRVPRHGFTLIELLVVIVIVALLSALAMPRMNTSKQRGHRTSGIADLRNLSTQQETFFNDHSRYGGVADSALLNLRTSSANTGLSITLAGVPSGAGGYSAVLNIPGSEKCGVFVGTALRPVGMPVTVLPGMPACW
jgi:prepilin-type N-terminal cleavage/methylation domain-containing protein